MNFPSQLLGDLVTAFGRFPGVGKKTAMRMAIHLLKQREETGVPLLNAIEKLINNIQFCSKCHNVSDEILCTICANPNRDTKTICVVADLRDVMAIEATASFKGVYHVLGGLIAPLEGITPDKLEIASLLKRVDAEHVQEILLALSATIEGDTTAFFIARQLGDRKVRLSSIARGIAVGGELEYIDEVTLGRSIQQRIPYQIFAK